MSTYYTQLTPDENKILRELKVRENVLSTHEQHGTNWINMMALSCDISESRALTALKGLQEKGVLTVKYDGPEKKGKEP